jgi:WD40 repeat protein
MDASTQSATKSASFTSNLTYVAFTQSGFIYVGKLESPGVFEIHCHSLPPHPFGLRPILALSPLRPNLLSISTGSRTSIWNIEDDSPKCTIHDSERSVTSSAWSTHDGELLALGSFDHISLYNVWTACLRLVAAIHFSFGMSPSLASLLIGASILVIQSPKYTGGHTCAGLSWQWVMMGL